MTEQNKEVEFKLINNSPPRILLKVPAEGDMNYLFLSQSQARYLSEELNKSLKILKIGYADHILVVSFPKETNND